MLHTYTNHAASAKFLESVYNIDKQYFILTSLLIAAVIISAVYPSATIFRSSLLA